MAKSLAEQVAALHKQVSGLMEKLEAEGQSGRAVAGKGKVNTHLARMFKAGGKSKKGNPKYRATVGELPEGLPVVLVPFKDGSIFVAIEGDQRREGLVRLRGEKLVPAR